MKRTAMFVLLLALTCVYCFAAQDCGKSNAGDEAAVLKTLQTFYDSARSDDLTLFHTIADEHFYAFDAGKRFEGDALMNAMKSQHEQGAIYTWTINDPKIHVACDAALITYLNRGAVERNGEKKDVTWIESAFLQKKDGHWKIVFFHSSRAQ